LEATVLSRGRSVWYRIKDFPSAFIAELNIPGGVIQKKEVLKIIA